MLREKIKEAIEKIDYLSKTKKIKVVSHFDTDGITSGAIFSKALARWDKKFSLEIVKGLDEDFVDSLSDRDVLIFLDLASGSLDYLARKKTEIFVFDHHEIVQEIPGNVFMINPVLEKEEPVSAAAICYLFAKSLSSRNKDLASLAVLGMVGDLHEKNIGKTFSEILADSETVVKKGLMIYPSTRPLDRALEYSSSPFIPGVTGNREGVLGLLRDSGIFLEGGQFKALYELNDSEMTKLITSVALQIAKSGEFNHDNLVGNIFLVKFFNRMEDARELSALINACSRMDKPEIALGFCLGSKELKQKAEGVYIEYKHSLMSALKLISSGGSEKIEGNGYLIINARDKVKDTIIGTVASILSHSPAYPEGVMIVALAYNQERIKVSARLSGRKGRNVRDVLHRAVISLGGEVGGHPNAAGCLISRDKEGVFIEELKKVLEIEVTKV